MTAKPFNPMYIQPGMRIGLYVVRDQLGHGSGSVAYLADSPEGRKVVLKVSLCPRKGDPEAAVMYERFLRQVDYLFQLRDVPGVAEILGQDFYPDRIAGYPYLVQEWIPGQRTIIDWASNPQPLKQLILAWTLLASTCGEMERRHICHRDLTPDNILVTPHGVPKIIDLKCAIGLGAQQLTATGAEYVPGTYRSYSPERCLAILRERATGKREPYAYRPTDDLHALGAIFYQVLTGEHPFDVPDDSDESLQLIAHAAPILPSKRNAAVPWGLEKVTARLLLKDPAQRYQSGYEVAEELDAFLKNTREDWSRPFQMPCPDRNSPSHRPQTGRDSPRMTTSKHPPPHTPTPTVNGSAAPKLPAPIGWSEPASNDLPAPAPTPAERLLVVPREQAERARAAPPPGILPAPAATLEEMPAPRRAHATWMKPMVLVVIGALALAVSVADAWQEGARLLPAEGSSLRERAAAALAATRARLAAGTSSALARIGPDARVRADDEAWLGACPPEAREATRGLDIGNQVVAYLEDGPNVITHEIGCEVKAGPVEVEPLLPGAAPHLGARLLGVIRTGSDGASLRFNRLRLGNGRELPVCAIAGETGFPYGPGLEKVGRYAVNRVPASELHAGFTYVTTGALSIQLAR